MTQLSVAVKEFDPAEYFDTDPALVKRAHNRPRKETLKTQSVLNADKLPVHCAALSTVLT